MSAHLNIGRNPRREWHPEAPRVISARYNHPKNWGEKSTVLKPAAAAFLTGGSRAAIEFLGSEARFVDLAPRIKAQVAYWERSAKRGGAWWTT